VPTTEDTNGNGRLDIGGIGATRWNAKDRIPAAAARNIVTFDPVANQGVDFLWGALNNNQKKVLDNASLSLSTSPILNYLRGDQSNEGDGAGDYRERTVVLGDIVNSDPLFVGSEDLGYSTLPEGSLPSGTGYAGHVSLKNSNPDMLYVGANDGILHGFQVDINPANGQEGDEVFGFVPNAAISPELVTLATDQNYTHKYFVDGAPAYGDVFFDSAWHTVLIGSMGSGSTTVTGGADGTGGRSFFALDITNPYSFNSTKVLWEFSNRNHADLGYTIPVASVVRLTNGASSTSPRWAAIVANGYNSPNGKAALYILDIKTGAMIGGQPIVADSPATKDNGLSTPTPVDVDGDKIIDYIYAGDLKGNMWKFDVTSSDPANWGVANAGKPLFVACAANQDPCTAANRQAITTKPGVVTATATDQGSGVMVGFATGKYFETGDQNVPATPQIQSVYGIWDKCDKTNAATCTDGAVSSRGQLEEQKITAEQFITALDSEFRFTTACEVAYGNTPPSILATGCAGGKNRRGWFMDLKSPTLGGQGERVVSDPIVRQDRVIFVTLIPVNTTCEPGGTGWFMELQINGARFTGSPIDVNKDNKIDENDLIGDLAMSGKKSKHGIIQKPAVVGGSGDKEVKAFGFEDTFKDTELECKETGCGGPPSAPPPPSGATRRSWRQIF
jgi:type IV pilus assembly protein PilY1